MRFMALVGFLVLLAPLAARGECQTGDPLCVDDAFTRPLPKSAPAKPQPKPAAPKPAAKKPPKPTHATAAPQTRKQAPTASDRPDKTRPSYTESIRDNGHGNDQVVRFDDDGLNGGAPKSATIRALPERTPTPMRCVRPLREIYREMYPNADALDEPSHPFTPELQTRVRAEHRKALKCLDPCRTEEDLDLLMSCYDPLAPAGQNPGCSGETLRKAIREGRLRDRSAGPDGVCADKVVSETLRSGRAKNDVVLLIDNSGSMSNKSQVIVPLVSAMVARKAKELGTDTHLILMTQNLDEKPLVLSGSDPALAAKVAAKVRDAYGFGAADAEERPLLALTKNLPGVVRPDAAINVIVLTDEYDSSVPADFFKPDPALPYEKSSAEYVARLRKLTEGGLKLHSTEPDDQQSYNELESQPLHAAARLTGGLQLALTPDAFNLNLDEMLVRGQEKRLVLGPLPEEINPDSILVTWDGRELAPSEFRYDPVTRMVQPAFAYDPEAKHEIQLRYQLRHHRQRELSRADVSMVYVAAFSDSEKQGYAEWPDVRKHYSSWLVLNDEIPVGSREEHRRHVRKDVLETFHYRSEKEGRHVPAAGLYLLLGHEATGVLTLTEVSSALDPGWAARLFDGDWHANQSRVLGALERFDDAQLASLLRALAEKKRPLPAATPDGSAAGGLELLMAEEAKGCDARLAAAIARWLVAAEKNPAPAQPRLVAALKTQLSAKHFTGILRCHGQAGMPAGKKGGCP